MNRAQWLVWLQRIVLVGWVFLFVVFVCLHRVDPDYGWHFRTGQYILKHGVPHSDIFTYSARNFPWIDHEWLSDVFIYAVASRWGYGALALAFGAIWSAAFLLGMRQRLSWIITGVGLGGLLLYIGARSDAWTAMGVVLTLAILDGPSSRYWFLAPLMGVWANLHAGFAAGLAIVALKIIVERSKPLMLWGGIALLSTLVNPYGYGLYAELWRTLSDSKLSSSITEWAPLSLNLDVAPYVVIVIVVLVAWRGWSFLRLVGIALCGAAIWSNRNMSLLVVGSAGFVSSYLGQIEATLKSIVVRGESLFRAGWFNASLCLGVGVLFPIALLLYPPALPGSLTLEVPSNAIASLRSQPCRGHLFNDYNYGGIIIWQLPGVPDYIDGRMPSWEGPRGSYLALYNRVLRGGSFAQAEFARYNIQCVLISKYDSSLSGWLSAQSDWHMTLDSQEAQLWRHGQ